MDERQAYFTARSACESISYAMEASLNSIDNVSEKFHNDLINISENEGVFLLETQFDEYEEKSRVMGEILSAKIIRHKNERDGPTTIYNYTIEVKTKKNETERILTKKMQRRETPVLDIGFNGFIVNNLSFLNNVELSFKNIDLNVNNSIVSQNQPVKIKIENGNLFLGKNIIEKYNIDKIAIELDKTSVQSDYGKNIAEIRFSNGNGNSYFKLNKNIYNSKNNVVPLSQKKINTDVPDWTNIEKSNLEILPISKELVGGKYYGISGDVDIDSYSLNANALNPIFLILTGESSISEITANDEGRPIVYIIVPNGKTLNLRGASPNNNKEYNEIYSIIYGEKNSNIEFEQDVKFIGHFNSDNVSFWDQAQNKGPIVMSPVTISNLEEDVDGKPLNGWVNGLYD